MERFLTNGSWTFDYLFGLSGEELGLYSAGSAAWFGQNVPMGDRILVQYGSNSVFQHANNLGTSTVATDQTGSELQDELFYPWGQDWTRAGQPYVMHFAGMHQLQDAGLYPTPNRDFTPNLGRWMTPDPIGGDVTNPQSLNRYAYVLNNPTTLTDPLGLDGCDQSDDPVHCRALCWSKGDDYPDCPSETNWPGGGGGYPVGDGGSSGGGAPAPPSAPPAGQPPEQGLLNSSGMPCIEPSFLTRFSLYAGEGVAKFLYWKNGKTKSVGWGAGGSLAGGKYGGGAAASGSWLDTFDINGNAAQVETVESGPAVLFGRAAIGGAQVQTSNNPVPQTPQSSRGWGSDPTTSVGAGVVFPAASVDLHTGGGTTITAGAGVGVKGVSTNLLPVYVYTKSTPYCW